MLRKKSVFESLEIDQISELPIIHDKAKIMVLSNTGYKEGHKSDRRTEKKGTVFC
jgi:hypothetical protein